MATRKPKPAAKAKKLGFKDVFGLTTDATGPSKSGYKPMSGKTKTYVGKDGKRHKKN